MTPCITAILSRICASMASSRPGAGFDAVTARAAMKLQLREGVSYQETVRRGSVDNSLAVLARVPSNDLPVFIRYSFGYVRAVSRTIPPREPPDFHRGGPTVEATPS